MSKYATVADDDVELNAYRHGDGYRPGGGYRDDPPDGSFDSEDGENSRSAYGDEDSYDEDYGDEEIAVQPAELRAASRSSSSSSSSCKAMKCVLFLTFLVAWLAGGKYYIDKNGVPDSLDGFLAQLKSNLEEWKSNPSDDKGEEEISSLVEVEVGEERSKDDQVEQGSEDIQHIEQINAKPDTTQDTAPEDEPVETKETRDDPDETEETEVESTLNQEEELHEPEVQDEAEEEMQEIVGVEVNNEVAEKEGEGKLDYLVGATGVISEAWSVVEQVVHDSTSFTQGLSYGPDNTIYETTGIYGSSKLRKINPETFFVEQSIDLDRQYFGEGSTYFTDSRGNGRIVEITWKEQTGFIYDADTLELIKDFKYTTTPPNNQGWGITYNPTEHEFIVSDGSPFLYFWDAESLQEKRKVEVTRLLGKSQNMLNELEYMDGLVCCNIWHADQIICVDPQDGKSVREYNFSSLYPLAQRGGNENVLNGIALGTDHVLITGKLWDRMYKITFSDWPSLFTNKNAAVTDTENESVELDQPELIGSAEQKVEEPVKSSDKGAVKPEEETSNSGVVEPTEEEEATSEAVDSPLQAQNTISTAYTVIEQVGHDKSSFTQGLSYGSDGKIYETTGLYSNSKLRKINPNTFEVEQSVDLDGRFFGEGSTFYTDKEGNSRIIEITWKSQTGIIYDADTFEQLSTFRYTTTAPKHEGWGITYNEANQEFIVSDGSPYLYFWDRDTLKEKRKVVVSRLNGQGQNMLNELEFMDGLVCCNIWHMDDIICVDPATGKSVREYDMSQLWPSSERGNSENVLNGIALGTDHVLITGKRWDRMYKVSFADWPTLLPSAPMKSVVNAAEIQDQSASAAVEGSTEYEEAATQSGEANKPKDDSSSDNALKSLSIAVENLPDYFVPLSPDERAELKKRLHDTIFKTGISLLSSANPIDDGDILPQRTFKMSPDSSKQFMHMHHMKTGGTSMDNLIHCAISRQLRINNNTAVQYSSMSECGSGVKSCMAKLATELNATVIDNIFYYNDDDGKPIMSAPFDPAVGEFESTVAGLNICKTSDCGVMSYCASLHTVRTFGWKDVDKITVIRNPIDRAWSMYRFTLQSCYKCKELKQVLKEVASGTFVARSTTTRAANLQYDPSDSCATQMIGHQATNLLSSIDLYNVANDVSFPREQEIVEEAVKNLRESFTWIGLTDRLDESVDGFRQVFPFLAENLTQAVLDMGKEFEARGFPVSDPSFSIPEDYVDVNGCKFPHENGGRAPTCGTKELDDETIDLILKLNNRDKAVYAAAVERFEIQMEVLEEYKAMRLR